MGSSGDRRDNDHITHLMPIGSENYEAATIYPVRPPPQMKMTFLKKNKKKTSKLM